MDILITGQEICLGVRYMIDRALGAKKIVGRVPILNGLCCKTSTSLIDSGDALSIGSSFFFQISKFSIIFNESLVAAR